MSNCVICNRGVSKGSFNLKDKYELAGGGFICKACAEKVGIKSMFSAGLTNAKKVREKYYAMYPEEAQVRRGDHKIDNEYVSKLCAEGKKVEACTYVKETGRLELSEAKKYVDNLLADIDNQFIEKINSIPNCKVMLVNELKYLRTALSDGEEVLHAVNCIIRKESVALFDSRNVVRGSNSGAETWLVALTNSRILLINRHLLVGTDCITLPLETINSVSYDKGIWDASITIMYGSSGIVLENIRDGYEKHFVIKANEAIRKIKSASDNQISYAAKTSFSVADEIVKLKSLLDQGIITQDEFDSQKSKLLK